MPRVSNDEFLSLLGEMYKETRESGSVTLSMKMVKDQDLSRGPKALRAEVSNGKACMVRAQVMGGVREGSVFANKEAGKTKRGEKAKISTILTGDQQAVFHKRFSEIIKEHTGKLKRPRDLKRIEERRQRRAAAAATQASS
ncbi:Signal recognition particle 14 kDa protein [Hondaea fermentalgiana]|uniref:Signal recognition particle 14 kDa protein n=1 Tax=Hondaea fermentalgiana TaxID=2315210 RepID=A0A2R5G861_9STRA|nr:Signal recognition particle 14 kDa protein [Hondaea fermentalgiana]|eukprot:GBG24673.1 Signal recognition particle 14 kDa protein [Hondaea fermentalgiana]